MANFLTSFATGGLKAGINQMNRVVEERGEILDNLRPVVQEKFSLLNDNTKKYSIRKFLNLMVVKQHLIISLIEEI
jgi:uncharacterized protein (UPF0335 family)